MLERHLAGNERSRIRKLHEYNILDTPSEPIFDGIVDLAARICSAPIAVMALVDKDREWFKAIKGLDLEELPLDGGFCFEALLRSEGLIVSDALLDVRFSNHPLVNAD
ncbi:MAG: PAS domain S-box protein, partial [Gammaproteobacteria bacterium]